MDKLTYLLLRQIERGATSPQFSALEQQFPRIAFRLVELWENVACGDYLRSLLMDDRGDRQGFPPDVMNDLILLDSIHWSNANKHDSHGVSSSFEFSFTGETVKGSHSGKSSKPASWTRRDTSKDPS